MIINKLNLVTLFDSSSCLCLFTYIFFEKLYWWKECDTEKVVKLCWMLRLELKIGLDLIGFKNCLWFKKKNGSSRCIEFTM